MPHTSAAGVNFGKSCDARVVATGIVIITAMRAMILNVLPTLLKLAIHFVGIEETKAWMTMISVVKRKVCQAWGI